MKEESGGGGGDDDGDGWGMVGSDGRNQWTAGIFAAAEMSWEDVRNVTRTSDDTARSVRFREQLMFLTEQVNTQGMPGADAAKWKELRTSVALIHDLLLFAHRRRREFDALRRTFPLKQSSPFARGNNTDENNISTACARRFAGHSAGDDTRRTTTDGDTSDIKLVLRRFSDDRQDNLAEQELATRHDERKPRAECEARGEARDSGGAGDREEDEMDRGHSGGKLSEEAMMELRAETARLAEEARCGENGVVNGENGDAREEEEEDDDKEGSLGSVEAVEMLQEAYDDEYAEQHEDEREKHKMQKHEELVVDTLLTVGAIEALLFGLRSAMRFVDSNPLMKTTRREELEDAKQQQEERTESKQSDRKVAVIYATDVLQRSLHSLLLLSLRRHVRDTLVQAGVIEPVLAVTSLLFERADMLLIATRLLHRLALHSAPRALSIAQRGGYSSAVRSIEFHFESELLLAISMRLVLVLNVGVSMKQACTPAVLDSVLARTVSALYEYEHVRELRLVSLRLLSSLCEATSPAIAPAVNSETATQQAPATTAVTQSAGIVERLASEDALEIIVRVMREDMTNVYVMEAALMVLKIASSCELDASRVIGDNGGMQLLLRALSMYTPRTNLFGSGERAYHGAHLLQFQSSRLAFETEHDAPEQHPNSATPAVAREEQLCGVVVERVLRVLQYSSVLPENRDRLKAAGVFAVLGTCMESFADSLVILDKSISSISSGTRGGGELGDNNSARAHNVDVKIARWSWCAQLISFCAVVANNLCQRSDLCTLSAQRVALVQRVTSVVGTMVSISQQHDTTAMLDEPANSSAKLYTALKLKLAETTAFLLRLMNHIAVLDAFLPSSSATAVGASDSTAVPSRDEILGVDMLREATNVIDSNVATCTVNKLVEALRAFRADLRVQVHAMSALTRMAFSQNPLSPRGTTIRPLHFEDSLGDSTADGIGVSGASGSGQQHGWKETAWSAAVSSAHEEVHPLVSDAIAVARSMLAACDLRESMQSPAPGAGSGRDENGQNIRLRAEKLEKCAILLHKWLAIDSGVASASGTTHDDAFLKLPRSVSHMVRPRSFIALSPPKSSASNSTRNSRMSISVKLSRKSSAVSLSPQLSRNDSVEYSSTAAPAPTTSAAAATQANNIHAFRTSDALPPRSKTATAESASNSRTNAFSNFLSLRRRSSAAKDGRGGGGGANSGQTPRRERGFESRARMRQLSVRSISDLVRQRSNPNTSTTAPTPQTREHDESRPRTPSRQP
eukprot:CAMPEP_0185846604 /NCGR_PEP_ID=MMETSP1354-20130828/2176_1 /TAXON_ID=708628 /ORGANISM="Erythrolobus madagascarensis, Strain CCMP3276" /LENGTH=1255 /DNA_ID=CAMNT_0028546757 /DNA_START=1 /DNA_END=3768 /DNA_ORIENTATION=+